MTHVNINDPRWQTAPITEWGPAWWEEIHEILEKVPCPVCQPKAVRDGHAFHDVKNAELGKPIRYPRDLLSFSKRVEQAVQKCHVSGSCPSHQIARERVPTSGI